MAASPRQPKRSRPLVLGGVVPDAGLDVEATYSSFADHLEIRGRVTDTTGGDRALDLAVRLPVSLVGYTWWDDVRRSRTVTAAGEYSNAISGDVGGFLPISLYPLAALTDQRHGLSVALPLDTPQLALLRYQDGAFEARFRLGTSPAATKLGPAASFEVYIMTVDPD